MSACSTSVSTEVQQPNQHGPLPTQSNLAKSAEDCPLQHQEDMKDNKQRDGNHAGNVDEYEYEDEDVDFNPFLKETHSVEVSSSLSSELEGLDTDVAESGEKASATFLNNYVNKHLETVHNIHPIEAVEHGEEIVIKTTVSSGKACGKRFDMAFEKISRKECELITQSESGSVCFKENGLDSLKYVTEDVHFDKLSMDVDSEDAIFMRTRARYSLASFTLDELETFLQETDDDDDVQNVDDEEEYRKFLAAVLQGRDESQNLRGNTNADDEDEDNDADFELELEEALESDPDEIEERRKSRRNKRQRGSLERNNKFSGQLGRPLRPLLPFAPMGSFPAFDGKHLMNNISLQPCILPVNNCFTSGFTPHQIGQLHCLIHEHLQLLVQVFSLCVLEPAKGHIALELKELILDLHRTCDQVLAWRSHPYPKFCFLPPYIHPSVPDEFYEISPSQCVNENIECEGSTGRHSDITSPSNGRCKHISNDRTNSFRTEEHTSWVPYICGPILTVIDVAPLRLVGNYIDDVYSAVHAYERYQIDLGFESRFEKEPLFPLSNSSVSAETDGQGDIRFNPLNSIATHSSLTSYKMPKKTMAATLVEKAKKQSVALVPKEIAKLAQRFFPLFNPALYPHKPPPAPIANRVLFTDAEDELLALGLMEYNTNWKAIQQRFLPCKSKHQIFVRQKNRASSKAQENPIKAVRRIKNSPLTSEEIARVEVGLKKLKLDWISIWRFFVPYRDPSLLPRLWRIASGTQKSYKSDANKKAKRRLYELRRKEARHLASMQHSSSEKEGNSTDAVEETISGDNRLDIEDEAYVHEAFLEGWRPDNDISLNYSIHKLSQDRASQANQQNDNSGSASLRPSKPQVILRPYRARRSNSARLVKLAPDLPPVNLPPSVRVMSQSAFQSSQAAIPVKFSGNYSRCDGNMANGVPVVGILKKSGVDYSVKSGQIMKFFTKVTTSNQQSKHSDKCVADERGDSDLQMHPLLFQPPQDGRLPYYPLNCSTGPSSSFTFFPGNQTQLDLNLFHNPRHIRDAVNFLSKSSLPPQKNSSSSSVDFHPLLQDTDDVSITALPVSKPSLKGRKISRPSGMGNELDLDIHLNVASTNQETVESGNVTQHGSDRSVRASEEFEIQKLIVDFYKNLYRTSEGEGSGIEDLEWCPLASTEAERLEENFSEEEIRAAVFECDGSKAPGPDGFTMAFYQKNWDTVKPDLLKVFAEFFDGGIINGITNETYICLIPKKKEAMRIKDFRPISLVTSLYKIMAKVLTNRLKKVMHNTIAQTQCAFIKGRQITDCCLIANEVVEEHRRKKKQGWVLKVDFEKAYDNVDWRYLDFVLLKKGFGERWRKWIKGCISNVSFSVFINGRPRGKFRGERGLRQGDPLSPFLFNLVIDGLGRMIDRAKTDNILSGLVVGKEKVEVSHIQFADDTLFLVQSADHLREAVGLLNLFCANSGLKINLDKSAILGLNHSDFEVEEMAKELGCRREQWPIKYLGAPLGGNPSKMEFWEPVVSKFSKKLANWKKSFLSRGGRLTLIKSVLSAMPTYFMSLFKMPSRVAKYLEKLMRDFLWDGPDGEKHCHVVGWQQVCKPLARGGLGLPNLRLRNLALLGKWWWRNSVEDKPLWKKVVGSIYGFQPNGCDVNLAKNSTFKSPWKFISRAYSTCHHLIGTVLKGGNFMRFWEDRWVGLVSFKECFPSLYRISSTVNKPINHFYSTVESQGQSIFQWDIRFRRDLNNTELEEFTTLLGVLDTFRLCVGSADVRVWLGDPSGVFSVSSLYDSLTHTNSFSVFPYHYNIWKVPIPLKVKVFSWIVALGKLQTCDVVQKRMPGLAVSPQWCTLCKKSDETQDHILLHCSFTTRIWAQVMQHLGFEWVFPRRSQDMLIIEPGFIKGKSMTNFWYLVVHCTFWSIWMERNSRIFREENKSCEDIWDSIRVRVATWAIINPQFQHITLSELARDWKFIC
ncbi:uncharacterized protein [Primulina eburnea]|uniref:uncharacterized protein isoform X2 n=1 Tax=Primulina eburnea TaxID=1245227 RepID=UPI003C6C680D